MTAIAPTLLNTPSAQNAPAPDTVLRRLWGSPRVIIGGGLLGLIVLACVVTLPLTRAETVGSAAHEHNNDFFYNQQHANLTRESPGLFADKARPELSPPGSHFRHPWLWLGTDALGRSIFSRCLLGGTISLTIGIAAAGISVFLGVTIGLIAGYRGGWVDSLLMRSVDIMYGLPYILLIILLKIALEPLLIRIFNSPAAGNLIVLFLAIGMVSWLTMARVIRGQVLSLRAQPFIESCRASGLTEWRVFTRHLLPNLIGPITVYATLTVPQAILEESFLSFLGIGIQPPVPTWGSLASDGLMPTLDPIHHYWYMLVIPCLLLSITLLSLNFLGDGLRDVFDPKRDAAKA
jgi:oligopeptide transport system permease protein